MKLDGKVALITGAASGIGRSMARRFSEEGAHVVAVDLDEARLGKVVAEIEDKDQSITGVVASVADPEGVDRAIAAAVAAATDGRTFTVLCNNAGVLDSLTPCADVDDELWEKVMGVNIHGPFMLCRRALPLFVEQGGGVIVNTTSAAGLQGGRAGCAYTVSKHGVVGLTRSVAWYYGPKGIRCNAIAPGQIQTRMSSSMDPHMGGFERYQPYFATLPPAGKAMDVADVALFLASDESRYINGAILPVDGGWMVY